MTTLSANEEEAAHLARMTAWLNAMTETERARYCPHGNSATLAPLPAPMGCRYCAAAA